MGKKMFGKTPDLFKCISLGNLNSIEAHVLPFGGAGGTLVPLADAVICDRPGVASAAAGRTWHLGGAASSSLSGLRGP